MHTLKSFPDKDGYRMPAEFEAHAASWMLWPIRTDIWRLGAKPAQAIITQLANSIVQFEDVVVGVLAQQYENARTKLSPKVQLVEISYDDIWIRDTGPSFLVNKEGKLRGVDWHFNAWGGIGNLCMNKDTKSSWNLTGSYFPWQLDDMVARKVLEIHKADRYRADFITEGGAFHVDGKGTFLGIKDCILNKNRNSNLSLNEVESKFRAMLGVKSFIWLERGLYLEENNGHIDNMCCFAKPGAVLLNWCDDHSDPQYEVSKEALDILKKSNDATGRNIEIIKVSQPLPLHINDEESEGIDFSEYSLPRLAGDRLPASYINSYFCNGAVIIPSFASDFDKSPKKYDEEAYTLFKHIFSNRKVVQIPSRELLLGGGGIHCVLQQVPHHK